MLKESQKKKKPKNQNFLIKEKSKNKLFMRAKVRNCRSKITNCHFRVCWNGQQLVLFWVMAYANLVVDIQKLLKKGHLVGEACKIHGREIGKSENAVSKAYYWRKQPGEVHGNSCLTEEEQKSLLYIAIALVNIQKPWTVDQMHKAAEDMFLKEISRSIIQRFLKKHSDDLGLGNTTPLSKD